jgi:hypothetical protein
VLASAPEAMLGVGIAVLSISQQPVTYPAEPGINASSGRRVCIQAEGLVQHGERQRVVRR